MIDICTQRKDIKIISSFQPIPWEHIEMHVSPAKFMQFPLTNSNLVSLTEVTSDKNMHYKDHNFLISFHVLVL